MRTTILLIMMAFALLVSCTPEQDKAEESKPAAPAQEAVPTPVPTPAPVVVVPEPPKQEIIVEPQPEPVVEAKPVEEIDYAKLPVRSKEYIPVLLDQQEEYWSDMQNPSIFCAQIEQETCPSLTHRMCWSPDARLKTSREEGYGLGQITRTWDAKGNIRFDVLEEVRQKHRDAFEGWTWKTVSNSMFQLRAIVFMDRDLFNALNFAETLPDRYAFMDAAYNGGLGGVLQDRAVCRNTPGCDQNVWFGNVEHTSRKAKTAVSGYGKSFFEINREHVKNVLKVRRAKYVDAGLE